MGYLNKENETHEAMTEDHWLKLGDLGTVFRKYFFTFLENIWIFLIKFFVIFFQVSTTKTGSFQFLENNQIL